MFRIILALTIILSIVTIVLGGLEYPHTLAGSVARFVFSLR